MNFSNIFGNVHSRRRKFIYSTIIMVIIFYFTGLTNIISHNKGINSSATGPLDDLGFRITNKITPDLEDHLTKVNDGITISLVVFCLIWIMIFNSGNRLFIFTHWFLMLAILFGIRIITVSSTILARPWPPGVDWPTCHTKEKFTGNLWLEVFNIPFKWKFTCFDFFYSGHTVNIVLVCLIITKWSQYTSLKCLVWFMTFFDFYVIIGIRAHYTIDVEMGLLLTLLFWIIMKYQVELKRGFFHWWLKKNDIRVIVRPKQQKERYQI